MVLSQTSVYSPYSLSATVYSLQSAVYSLQSTVKTINWGVPAQPRGRPASSRSPPPGPPKNSSRGLLKTAKFQFFELLAASGNFWERLRRPETPLRRPKRPPKRPKMRQDGFFEPTWAHVGPQHGAMLAPKSDQDAILCQNSLKAKNYYFSFRIS